MEEKCCGNCKWHWCDDNTWFCNNHNSENYEELTEYEDTCDQFEEI